MSENIFDGQAHEDEIIKQIEWGIFVRLGIEARQLRDKSNWTLGDVALAVETKYGAHSLKRYAEEIDVAPESLKVYRWVAGYYEKDDRFDELSLRHHQMVARLPDRHELLKRAAEGTNGKSWTTREFARWLKEQNEANQGEFDLGEFDPGELIKAEGIDADLEDASIEKRKTLADFMQEQLEAMREHGSAIHRISTGLAWFGPNKFVEESLLNSAIALNDIAQQLRMIRGEEEISPEEKVTRVNNLWRFPQEQEHDVYDDLPYPEPLDETIQRFADTAADSEFALKNFENALKGLSFENDDGISVMEQLVDLSRQSINNVRLINEKVQSIQKKHT